MDRIVYTRPDGGISIVVPAAKKDLEKVLGVLTDEQYEAHVLERSVPADAINVASVKYDAIPADRSFRNAWIQSGDAVTHDMEKAKEIHLDNIRAERARKFKEMGFPFQLNPQIENTIFDLQTRQLLQKLRDIPQTLDLSKVNTPEELKMTWPTADLGKSVYE